MKLKTPRWIKEGASLAECDVRLAETIKARWFARNGAEKPFQFVGIMVQGDTLLQFYPKYWKQPELKRFRQVVQVMERYRARQRKPGAVFEDAVMMFTASRDGENNRLAVLLGLLRDYHENGLYIRQKDIIESNGAGEIHWDKTVNDTLAILQENQPYYVDLRTRRRMDDEYDFFRRLHGAILTAATCELQEAGLLELFGIAGAEVADESWEEFGEREYILYRLEQEENWQFNTRKQHVLRMMHAFLSMEGTLQDEECLTVFGTFRFHVVWEDVCKVVLGDQLDKELGKIAKRNHFVLHGEFSANRKKQLKQLIDKPCWKFHGTFYEDNSGESSDTEEYSARTLIPDVITFEKDEHETQWFLIFDAKYYVPVWGNGSISGQPGIGDITKQYLYHLAYHKFTEAHGMEARNCLLFPWDGADGYVDMSRSGIVSLEMMKAFKTSEEKALLKDIAVRFVSAEKFYTLYLSGTKLTNICQTLNLLQAT